MELCEYLKKSEEKRRELKKNAEKYIANMSNSIGDKVDNMQYPGPCIKRFQVFKKNVDDQIKKLFRPEYNDFQVRTPNKCVDLKEEMSKIYSENYHLLERRRISGKSMRERTLTSNPSRRNEMSKNSSKKIKIFNISKNDIVRQSLLMPILKTTCNHEVRSKIYKLK